MNVANSSIIVKPYTFGVTIKELRDELAKAATDRTTWLVVLFRKLNESWQVEAVWELAKRTEDVAPVVCLLGIFGGLETFTGGLSKM